MRLLLSGMTRTLPGLLERHSGHLGWITTPSGGCRLDGPIRASGLPWAIDNGAFSGFDAGKFRARLERSRGMPGCVFVVAPDVVGDAVGTLSLFAEWADEVRGYGHPVALVGQDGAELLALPWGEFDAWFIGGSTAWKLSAASEALAIEAKTRGKYLHMGRVNSLRRMRVAQDFGCDSVDGSGATRFGDKYVGNFCRWIAGVNAQGVLW